MSLSVQKTIRVHKLPIEGSIFGLITAAGSSSRYGSSKKELEDLEGLTVLERAVEPFIPFCNAILITCPKGEKSRFEELFSKSKLKLVLASLKSGFIIAEGGKSRQESVLFGLRELAANCHDKGVVLIHDGARPWISKKLIEKTLNCARERGACLPLMPLTETPKIVEGDLIHDHPARGIIMSAQTPQAFSFPEILAAYELAHREGFKATDDAMIWDRYVGPVSWIEGERQNRKITFKEDLVAGISSLESNSFKMPFSIGLGYDIHPLVDGRPLLLAGVLIESEKGESGYSDGDVLWHAIIDAMLGAAAIGDIGLLFPPGEPEWKNADSSVLAKKAFALIRTEGWQLANIDCTVIIEKPKLAPYREAIRASISRNLDLSIESISLKAKTKEGFDATGHGEAIEAHAVVLIYR